MKFAAFYGSRRCITHSQRPTTCPYPEPDQFPHPTSWRSTLILSSCLRVCLPSGKTFYIQKKESRNKPGVAQRVPGGLGSQIAWHLAREGGEVVSIMNRPPLPPGSFLVLIFTRGWVDPRAMVRSEGNMSLKNPVTPPGIDSGTVRLVAQRLNHYATPGPKTFLTKQNFSVRLTLFCVRQTTEIVGLWSTTLDNFVTGFDDIKQAC
jgi:hypothetical protein